MAINVMSLIDYSEIVKISMPVSNYILLHSRSHRLVVRFSGIMEDIAVDVEHEV